MGRRIKCKECGEVKVHCALGLCSKCYLRLARQKKDAKNKPQF